MRAWQLSRLGLRQSEFNEIPLAPAVPTPLFRDALGMLFAC
jgi:hypothetical protein